MPYGPEDSTLTRHTIDLTDAAEYTRTMDAMRDLLFQANGRRGYLLVTIRTLDSDFKIDREDMLPRDPPGATFMAKDAEGVETKTPKNTVSNNEALIDRHSLYMLGFIITIDGKAKLYLTSDMDPSHIKDNDEDAEKKKKDAAQAEVDRITTAIRKAYARIDVAYLDLKGDHGSLGIDSLGTLSFRDFLFKKDNLPNNFSIRPTPEQKRTFLLFVVAVSEASRMGGIRRIIASILKSRSYIKEHGWDKIPGLVLGDNLKLYVGNWSKLTENLLVDVPVPDGQKVLPHFFDCLPTFCPDRRAFRQERLLETVNKGVPPKPSPLIYDHPFNQLNATGGTLADSYSQVLSDPAMAKTVGDYRANNDIVLSLRKLLLGEQVGPLKRDRINAYNAATAEKKALLQLLGTVWAFRIAVNQASNTAGDSLFAFGHTKSASQATETSFTTYPGNTVILVPYLPPRTA